MMSGKYLSHLNDNITSEIKSSEQVGDHTLMGSRLDDIISRSMSDKPLYWLTSSLEFPIREQKTKNIQRLEQLLFPS